MSTENSIHKFLEDVPHFALQPLHVSPEEFSRTHTVYTGVPRRHGHDSDRLILIAGLESGCGIFYEFFIKDIDRWKSVENMMMADGTALPVVRVWVKHGAYAIKSEPFVVQGNDSLQAFLEL